MTSSNMSVRNFCVAISLFAITAMSKGADPKYYEFGIRGRTSYAQLERHAIREGRVISFEWFGSVESAFFSTIKSKVGDPFPPYQVKDMRKVLGDPSLAIKAELLPSLFKTTPIGNVRPDLYPSRLPDGESAKTYREHILFELWDSLAVVKDGEGVYLKDIEGFDEQWWKNSSFAKDAEFSIYILDDFYKDSPVFERTAIIGFGFKEGIFIGRFNSDSFVHAEVNASPFEFKDP